MGIITEEAKLKAQTNVLLRQVDPGRAEVLIDHLQKVLMPPAGSEETVAMPDAVAATCAVLAMIVMTAKDNYRTVLVSVIGNLIAHNLHGASVHEAIENAADEATKAERGTANALPI